MCLTFHSSHMDERIERRDILRSIVKGNGQRLRDAVDQKGATVGRRDVFYYR